jgi:hypothetical protein
MSAFSDTLSFAHRASAALLRRGGNVLTRLADDAYARSLRLPPEELRLVSRNEKFRNIHKEQRCFIIGNGPSIQHQDLSLLDGEVTFVMNAFWKHPVVTKWQPSYYFFSDGAFFDRSELATRFFSDLRQHIHSSTFFAPVSQKTLIEEDQLLPSSQTNFFGARARLLGEDKNSGFDFTGNLPWVLVVAQFAIMAAMFMGCSPIYLIGLDHDWLSHHGERGYYFFPGLTFGNSPEITTDHGNYQEEMESMLKVWKGYRHLDALSQTNGMKIINATHGGFLDVFDRAHFPSLFPAK